MLWKKVAYSKILCRLCRICEVAAKVGMKAKEHNCIKNWTDTSKRMESAAILQMLTSCQNERKFVTQWIISDDDSTIRAVCSHPDPTDPETKGKLPKNILQPIFKANPSHRVKVVAKKWYKLKAQPVIQ